MFQMLSDTLAKNPEFGEINMLEYAIDKRVFRISNLLVSYGGKIRPGVKGEQRAKALADWAASNIFDRPLSYATNLSRTSSPRGQARQPHGENEEERQGFKRGKFTLT
jgi:hypothetical protein